MLNVLLVNLRAIPILSGPNFSQNPDLNILNFALTLEHLESAFYSQGLNNFSAQSFQNAGYGPQVYPLFQQIAAHESSHVSKLTSIIQSLNGNPVPPCTYNFNVPNVNAFVDTAKALENTGVSAYLGAAFGITDHNILSLASSILTVEARQGTMLKILENTNPYPNTFDIGLDSREITSIASQFIVQCNYNLPKPFPTFAVSKNSGKVGDSIGITFGSTNGALNCVFLTGSGRNVFVPLTQGQCQVPSVNTGGDTYVILTTASSMQNFNDGTTVAGPVPFTITQ